MSGKGFVIGVDIGGTFTDFCMVDRETGRLYVGKQLTTPHDPSEAFLEGVEKVVQVAGEQLRTVQNLSHASTLITNAIIERKGVPTGLITTKGHLDTLTIGREARYEHYDIRLRRPEPLVPRRLIREVDERVAWDGRVTRPLVLDGLREAVRELQAAGVRSLAVCLLHSYRSPEHERLIKDLVAQEFPGLDCSISSDVSPEIREFERTSTTVANAYVRPLVQGYLLHLDRELKLRGFAGEFHLMLSNGGITTAAIGAEVPIRAIESGPAAGALAASLYGKLIGKCQILAFDMGGTTAKICFLQDGNPKRANRFEAARVQRFKKGSGLPLSIPVIELIEIGAGGGSVAHMDSMGLLKVGPRSAGARPGPVAYGQGGEEPTVTDADLILGYIAADRFLGGEMQLKVEAARDAISERIARPLGLSVEESAWGIFSVVSENMATAAKLYAAEQGIDPRQYAMIAFGGAGPLHAFRIAQIMGINTVVYPYGAGVASAIGLCTAPQSIELSRSLMYSLEALELEQVVAIFTQMEEQAVAMVCAAGARLEEVVVSRTVDMRFSGQGYEVEVPLADELSKSAAEARTSLRTAFNTTYAQHFGRTPEGGAIEALTWRLKASGPAYTLDLKPQVLKAEGSMALRGNRLAYFHGQGGFVDCPVYDRYALVPGDLFTGPALIEERETTVVVGPGAEIKVDNHLNLIVSL